MPPVQPLSCPLRFVFQMVGVLLCLAMPVHVLADVTRANEDKKKKDRAPAYSPEAKSQTVTFVAGVATEIELSAAVGSLKQVEFVIRQAPQRGTLSTPRAHPRDNNKAIVTYTPRDASSTEPDSFTYACRVDGGSMSAPATVTLNGKEFDPQLEVLGAPRFDRVFLSGEATARVSVKNKGPAPFKSSIAWESPWMGPPELEVPAGKTVELNLIFRPTQAGSFRHQITLQPGLKESILYLYGECIQVLTISPGRLALNFSPTTGERSGVLTIVNTRADPTDVVLKLPARLQGPKTLKLDPLAKSDVVLKLLSDDRALFQDEVTVETDTMSEKVLVVADPKPGQMKLLAPAKGEEVKFGEVKIKSKAHAEVTLSNVGGQPIIAGARVSVPFFIEEAGQALRLEPGQQRNLSVELSTERVGKFSGTLEITGGGEAISVPLVGEVVDPAAPPPLAKTTMEPAPPPTKPQPLRTAATTAPPAVASEPNLIQSTVLAVMGSQGLPIAKKFINQYLEQPGPLEQVERTTTTITLAWAKPAVAPAGWILEVGGTSRDTKHDFIFKSWQRLDTWKLLETDDPEKVIIKIEQLPSAGQFEFRVLARDREGKVSRPSGSIVVETKVPWSVPSWVWRVLIIGALAIIIYMLQKVRRGEFEFEF